MINYKEIVDLFETAVSDHKYLKYFRFGTLDNIDSTINSPLPMAFLRPMTSPGLITGTDGRSRELTFELYVLDQPKLSDEDGRVVLSNTEQALYDLYSFFYDGSYQQELDITMATIIPVNEAFQNRLSGWVATISIVTSAKGISYCNIP